MSSSSRKSILPSLDESRPALFGLVRKYSLWLLMFLVVIGLGSYLFSRASHKQPKQTFISLEIPPAAAPTTTASAPTASSTPPIPDDQE
ncbi:MAG: hypothetical protein HQL73_05415 [Magnetococcales bacterium]|nr:hypothetical protein [Magnetococcales bacterium]